MKIELKNITIDNEDYNNDNFVEITTKDFRLAEVSIDDLYAALSAFIELRKKNSERDKPLDN